MPFPGEIVGSFAHLHKGAILLKTSTKDGLVCESAPLLDDAGRISSIPHCLVDEAPCQAKACGSLPRTLAKGDKVFVESVYAQDDRPHYGVMGFANVLVHRTDYM